MTRPNGEEGLSADTALRETELEIERTRERLAASIGALREEITTLVDWREWIRARPAVFVGGAFTLGLLLGWRAAGR
jgi:hypothetical protein